MKVRWGTMGVQLSRRGSGISGLVILSCHITNNALIPNPSANAAPRKHHYRCLVEPGIKLLIKQQQYTTRAHALH
eukprot:4542757-Prorocentrum_lima.AAC.1